MIQISRLMPALLIALFALPCATDAASTSTSFGYQSTAQTPSGTQSVAGVITIAPINAESTNVTLAMNGKPPVALTIPANGTASADALQGVPSSQRAQAQLILERVAMLRQMQTAHQQHAPLEVRIPILPPGASQPLMLAATLMPATQAGGEVTLVGSASVATSATIDATKAKIHGILPIRRVAQRLKRAVEPSTVTVPDQAVASIRASVKASSITSLSGSVVHTLSGNGKSVAVAEKWELTTTH